MDLLFMFGFGLAVLLCVFVSVALSFHRQHQKYDHLPGPPRDSFWRGHIPSIEKVIAAGGIIDNFFIETSKTYGLIFRLCWWNKTYVIVLDPEGIKEAMVIGSLPRSKQMYENVATVFGARFFGQGIASLGKSEKWTVQRMHFDKWFKPQYIRQLAFKFNELAENYVRYLEHYADGKTEVHTLNSFTELTTHVLYKVAFNIDLGPFSKEVHPFVSKLQTALSGTAALIANPFVAINPFKWRFRQNVRDAINTLRQGVKQVLDERNKANLNGEHVLDDLMEHLMRLKEKHPSVITEDIVVDNFITFLTGGHDTSAKTLHFMVFLLGKNPECYKKLQREIDENTDTVSVISLDELAKLPYLDQVLKETQRLYPVAKMTARHTFKDRMIGGHLIPAGTDMMFSFYATSRVEQNMSNPMKFLPERFHSDSSERFSKYAFTPFAIGPHSCIGKNFALTEMKIIIVKIMQNFDFELVPGQSFELKDFTLIQMKDGVKCFFRPRRMVATK